MLNKKEMPFHFLIREYIKHSQWDDALVLYEKTKKTEFYSLHTFMPLLKACAELQCLEGGQEIHSQIYKSGFEIHPFVSTTLINLYTECGYLEEAQKIFDKLQAKDIACWNALIAGYAKEGCGRKALFYFELMQEHGITPNTRTFVSSLKACGILAICDKGQELHAEIVRRGLLQEHNFVGNALLDMYAKCGLVAQAREVFCELSIRDAITWNALVVGHANCGYIQEACKYLELMKSDGNSLNSSILLLIMKACTMNKAIESGLQLHSETIMIGFIDNDLAIGITLVDMYASSGWFEEAQRVLQVYCIQEVAAWTALINGYVYYDFNREALECFNEMQEKGISPNHITFVCCLKACSNIRAFEKGQEIHNEINQLAMLEDNLPLGNALLDMYAKCGYVSKVKEVFDVLSSRDIVSWTALLGGYIDSGYSDEALKLFNQMKREGTTPDAVTYVFVLKACANIGAGEEGMKIHEEISEMCLLEKDLVTANALIDMYSNCGMLSKAWAVFDELKCPDVISGTSLVAGLIRQGYHEEALECIDQMQQKGIILDCHVLTYGLQVCGNLGLIGRGRELHGVVCSNIVNYSLLAYNALIDMYAKSGFLASSVKVFNTLADRDVTSWNTLITGYAQLGDIDNVLFYYRRMVKENKKPNSITFLSLLTACSHSGVHDLTDCVFEVMVEENELMPSLGHFTCGIDLLGRVGQLDKMLWKITQIPFQPSLIIWHCLLSACKKSNNYEIGRAALKHVMQVEKNDIGSLISLSNICDTDNSIE
ncbi:hypothetical protein KP509_13G098600 [Ceratopteris richardii]|nr:hypothetical protein KP509_13G098600 [Ceratopteris richardii]